MLFSVIVPVYNVEMYLRQCLDSLVNQSLQDMEILVIDDGSTDKSGEICDEYASRFSCVRVIHQENQGLSSARNKGLLIAGGEWIAFVDSDDWVDINMLDNLKTYIDEYNADIYSYNYHIVDECGIPTEQRLFVVENEEKTFFDEVKKFNFYFNILLQYKVGWEACGRIYRHSIILDHDLKFIDTQEVFAEDLLFLFQYMLYVRRAVMLCNLFYYYRQREGSLSKSILPDRLLGGLATLTEHAYDSVKKEKMNYFQNNFYLLYFMIFNHHMQQLPLSKYDCNSRKEMIKKISNEKFHKKNLDKLIKYRNELNQYMWDVKWI